MNVIACRDLRQRTAEESVVHRFTKLVSAIKPPPVVSFIDYVNLLSVNKADAYPHQSLNHTAGQVQARKDQFLPLNDILRQVVSQSF